MGRLDDALVAAWRNGELGACVNSLLELVSGEDGSCAKYQLWEVSGGGLDGFGGGSGAEGDFRDGQSAFQQGLAELEAIFRSVNGDDGDDAVFA